MPVSASTKIILTRPASGTGSYPTTSEVDNAQVALFYLYYDGAGFTVGLLAIDTYQLSSNITVKIQYKRYSPLQVSCNIDLCKLACSYLDFIRDATRKCGTVDNSDYQYKMSLMNGYYNIILTAIQQP